jgi:ribonucleotide monophosphatase NagD (HAD superfamily)
MQPAAFAAQPVRMAAAPPQSECVCAARGMGEVVAAGRFRGVILDQFGVLHDGAAAYPAAAAALAGLRAAGLSVVILSNSSRRAAHAAAKLAEIFPAAAPGLDVVTSGELARDLLRSPDSPVRGAARVLHTNWAGRGKISAADNALPVRCRRAADVAADPASVDAIVAHGAEAVSVCPAGGGGGGGRGREEEPVEPLPWEDLVGLVAAVARARPETPMVCVNPDVVTVDGAGGLRPMPGALARAYEDAGGRSVLRVGKPGSPAYAAALALLAAKGVRPDEVVCVGDSAAHDIAGAQAHGLASVYIAGGIDGASFGLDPPAGGGGGGRDAGQWEVDWAAWDAVVVKDAPGIDRPTAIMDYFKW